MFYWFTQCTWLLRLSESDDFLTFSAHRIDVVTVTWSEMNLELGFSYDILNDSYAAGFGALCLGSVLLLPFALKYGRRPVYVFSLALQMGICIWSARQQTVADLMLVNILCCLVGALAEVILQMTVADVFVSSSSL